MGLVGMKFTRKMFLESLGQCAAAVSLQGCIGGAGRCRQPKIALQLYSIREYVAGNGGCRGVGMDKALEDVAAIGYRGVEFAGYYEYEKDPRGLRRALKNAGVVPCGCHSGCLELGLDTRTWKYDADVLKATCDYNMSYGNNMIVNPGGGNFPPGCSWATGMTEICKPTAAIDEFSRRLADAYERIADDAAKMGCRIGLHNHIWEHAVFMQDGMSFWDYMFSHTSERVCMEQDVGWTTCAGVDPAVQYAKHPHRSVSMHAKENGQGRDVTGFEGVLGEPGCPKSNSVRWEKVIEAAVVDGVEWAVVECERHCDDLSAIVPSYVFLKKMGLS